MHLTSSEQTQPQEVKSVTLDDFIDTVRNIGIKGSQRKYGLSNFKKKREKANLSEFSVRGISLFSKEEESSHRYFLPRGVYSDCNLILLLSHRIIPVAVVGFDIQVRSGNLKNAIEYLNMDNYEKYSGTATTDAHGLIIEQIQGAGGSKDRLAGLRWEKMIVSLVERLALNSGFNSCMIQQAKDNLYYHNEDVNPTALHIRYDITAKRMGYKLIGGVWMKELSPRPPS